MSGVLAHWLGALSNRHSWLSIYRRNPCATVTSVDRVFILYTSLLMGASIGAVFARGTDPTLKNKILTILYSALTTTIFAGATVLAFQPGLLF